MSTVEERVKKIVAEQLGVKLDTRVHTTRLKQCLLAQFTDMQAQKKGRDVLMAFEEDIGTALAKACEFDKDKFDKEDQCETDSTYQGCSGTTCKESNLPGRSCVGPVTASNSCTSFAN